MVFWGKAAAEGQEKRLEKHLHLSLSPMPLSSWPSTCSCEKLEQLLARLGTTLINLVDKGPRESGGGIGGGIGGGMGMGVGVVVGAEQRAALREA